MKTIKVAIIICLAWSSLFSQIHAERFLGAEVPHNAMKALQMFHEALPIHPEEASQAITELTFTGKYRTINYGFRSEPPTPEEARTIQQILTETGAAVGRNNNIAYLIRQYSEGKGALQAHTQKCLDIIKVASLRSYLQQPYIPEEVFKIAVKGVENYQRDPLKRERKNALAAHTTGGGRGADWIQQTFGQTEQKLMAELEEIAPPQTWRVKDINALYDQLLREQKSSSPQQEKKSSSPQFTLVYGVSANYIPNAPTGPGSIGQAASQFDYRESPGAYRNPVSSYLNDPTQGPQMSIEAAAAARCTVLQPRNVVNYPMRSIRFFLLIKAKSFMKMKPKDGYIMNKAILCHTPLLIVFNDHQMVKY
jgi:hypothetical protein